MILNVVFNDKETAMGTTVDAQNQDSAYVRAVSDMRAIFIRRCFSPWKTNDWLFQFSDDYKLQKECLKILHRFTLSIIEERRRLKQTREANTKNVDDNEVGVKKRLALLDLLLDSKIDGRDWTNDEIREEVDTFMFEVKFFVWYKYLHIKTDSYCSALIVEVCQKHNLIL